MQQENVTEVLANLSISTIVGAALVLTLIRLALLPQKNNFARSIAELVESLIIAGVLVFLIIRPFFLQAFFIPSESMEPTLMGHRAGMSSTGKMYNDSVNDHIFVNKLIYRLTDPKSGDIIVFRAPKEADIESKYSGRTPVENVLIKRLIAVGGDTVEVKEDGKGKFRLFKNGNPVDESNIKFNEEMEPLSGTQFATSGPLKLAPDELFVMGDNRNHSNDGRFWGPLKRDRVMGKAMFTFWPLSRIGLVK